MKSLLLSLLCFSVAAFAAEKTPPPPSCVYIGAAGGYGLVSGMRGSDGQTPQGRFAIGADAYTYKRFTFGFEGAVQSGNTMRLEMSQAVIDAAGGLPIQTTLKPLLDFLVTTRWKLDCDFSLLLKGGIAYRNLQFNDRTSSEDSLHRINGELQAGIGYQLTKRARITAFYQFIYSGENADVTLAPNNDVLLGQIPTQQGAFVGVEWAL